MLSLLGSAVNVLAIITGSFIGLFWRNINENMKTTIIQGLSITVIVLGIDMAMESKRLIIVVISIAFGAMLGEKWQIEEKMNHFGVWLETKTGAKEGGVAAAFVTATLVYVVGAVGIVGALDSGLRGDHTLLFTKSLIDGIFSIFLTSTLGIGIIFSALPVFLFQGSITLFAAQIDRFILPEMMAQFIAQITGVGGIMIIAIGIRLLGIVNIRVANMLPAIPIIMLLVFILY
ncbi:DUF554 domain-containing protein [Salinicoccus sp. CNSTN-B1]